MEKLTFPYRSPTHLPFLHVISESGSWEKYGLEVEYDKMITSSDAHDAVAKGTVDFVGGNHVSTYGRRARGDDWIYLGQTINRVPGWKLVCRADSGITGVADLRKKRVVSQGKHPGLNDWLYLKQHGLDPDREDVELLHTSKLLREQQQRVSKGDDEPAQLWTLVRDGIADAAFITPPQDVLAARAGLRLIDMDHMPMIFFTTISTGARFAEKHPELIERFLKGTIEGIHWFKTHPDRAIDIIVKRYSKEGPIDREMADVTYRAIAEALEPKLYPSAQAIANVYQEGIRQDGDALKMHPMELWDLHFLRRLEDTGFMKNLYADAPAALTV